jgi:recombination protein RecT
VIIIEADEVEHLKKKAGSQWGNYYNDMFKKHALKRALKAQFGIEIDDQESSNQESYEPTRQRVDITPTEHVIETEEGPINEEDQLKEQWSGIYKKIEELGWTKNDLKSFIKEKLKKTAKELTLQEVVGLAKLIELQPQTVKAEPQQDEMDIEDFDQYFDQE